MLWFNLSLASAVAKAANQAVTKTLTRDFSVLQTAAYGQLAAGAFILPLIFFSGCIDLPADSSFHQAAFTTISLNIVAILLLVEAIRTSDLSYALPFLGLTPVISIFSGWLLRGEVMSAAGILGIVMVFLGAFSIDAKSWHDWTTLGGRRIFRDNGVQLVLIVAFLYSVSSVYDKTATLLSDPRTFVWYSTVIRAAILLIFLCGKNMLSNTAKKPHRHRLKHFLLFTFLGITFLVEALSQMFALQTGLVAFVIAIKRLSILMTSLAGMLVFREMFSRARLAGAGLIVAGAMLIYLSS